MTFNTGNNVPSTDPRDLYDNAENLDKLVNGVDPFYADRKGKLRQSWAGMENDFDTAQEGRETSFTLSQADKESRFQAFLVSSGYVSKGDYAAGVVLEERNEYVAVDAATTGTSPGLYRPNASATLPLTLTGTWATDSANLVLLGDDVLRQELASAAGASMVGGAGQVVPSISALRNLLKTTPSKSAFVTGYYAQGDGGGGDYYLDASDTTSVDNGGTVIIAVDGGRWKLTNVSIVSIRQFGAKGDGANNDGPSIQAAIDWWAGSARTGAIYAPAGNYVTNARINVPKLAKGLLFYGVGEGTTFRGGSNFASYVFYIGGTTAAGGTPYEFKDFKIAAPLSGTTNGIRCQNANTIRFRGVTTQSFVTGFELTDCFAVRFTECVFDVGSSYAIYSYTAAHNIVIDACRFFTVGGTVGYAIELAAATDNIVIQNSDFEYCRSVYKLTNASAVRLVGNYIEYCSAEEFAHDGAVRGWECSGNWIAIRQGSAVAWNNIQDGEFKFNTLYNIAASWGANVRNLDVGLNTIRSGATLAATPFFPVSGYSNAWVAGSRTPGYTKSADGTVYLRGEISTGTLNTLAFNLPTGYRPSQQMRFAVGAGAGNTTFGAVIVDANGNVVPQVGSPMSLDGVCFKAASA